MENVMSAVMFGICSEPDDALLPLQPPPAMQELAPTLVHVKVVGNPSATDDGSALKVTVGAGGGATVTVTVLNGDAPPVPEQLRLYVAFAVKF